MTNNHEISLIHDYNSLGKNQIAIPAAIANRIGRLKSGSRIDWQLTFKSEEIRCIVLPEPSVIAASLRGAGKRFFRPGQNPGAALLAERSADDAIRSTTPQMTHLLLLG